MLNQPIINISGYRFVTLYNTRSLKPWLQEVCAQLQLKGSIVLAPEGINVMLAGTRSAIDQFNTTLHQDRRLAGMEFKESASTQQPFQKLLVKCKASLVPGAEDVRPDQGDVAASLSPAELKAWYEEQRDFIIIDTRNAYELEHGTFEGAVNLQLEQFAEFPEKLEAAFGDHKDKPIVLFCTGGIRCEKGAPKALKMGFKQVYQLDGGILNYFKHCGSAHYQGSCFVFDERVALNPELQPTDTTAV